MKQECIEKWDHEESSDVTRLKAEIVKLKDQIIESNRCLTAAYMAGFEKGKEIRK